MTYLQTVHTIAISEAVLERLDSKMIAWVEARAEALAADGEVLTWVFENVNYDGRKYHTTSIEIATMLTALASGNIERYRKMIEEREET